MGTTRTISAKRSSRGGATREAATVAGDTEITCNVATDWTSYWKAFRLVYDAYLQVGLTKPNRLRLRFLPHQLLESSSVMLAVRGGVDLGTLSIVEDAAYGLPLEMLYPAEIAGLRRRNKRIAELTCLALQTSRVSQGERMQAMSSMLQAAIGIAARRQIDVLAICIHPRHAKLYRDRLGFISTGVQRVCPWVCDQPAVAMFRTLEIGSLNRSPQVSSALASELTQLSNPLLTGSTGNAIENVREVFEQLLDVASPLSHSPKLRRAA